MFTCRCCGDTAKGPAASTFKEILAATGYERVFSFTGEVTYLCKVCAKRIGDKAREIQRLLNDPQAYVAWNHMVRLGAQP